MELVSETVARAATPGTGRIPTLDHETVDDPVEDGAVIEFPGFGGAVDGIGVLPGATG